VIIAMLHPTALGIRPQYIVDYPEETAKTCPLEKIVMICHGLEFDSTHEVKSCLTTVTGDVIVDAIRRRVPPHPLRPEVNGWLYACATAWEERGKPSKPGRSRAADFKPTGSQEWDKETELQRSESPILIDIDRNESLILFSHYMFLKLYFVD
jgi:hypothetical protein